MKFIVYNDEQHRTIKATILLFRNTMVDKPEDAIVIKLKDKLLTMTFDLMYLKHVVSDAASRISNRVFISLCRGTHLLKVE